MSASAAPPPHLHQLTGLRGLAAWAVVLYHARLTLTDWLPASVVAAAGQFYLAVDLFFLLSGFVMWLNYGQRLRAGGWGEARCFWWRRFARIWPLHAAVLAALFAFVAVLIATGRNTAGFPLAELPLHLLLVQNWGFTQALSWNHPAWSISAEMGAYLLFPLLVAVLRWEALRPAALMALIAGVAVGLAGIFALAGEPSLGGQIPRLGLARAVAGFVIGMALANLWHHWRGKGWAAPACALAGAALLAVGTLAGLSQPLFVPLALAALLLGLALAEGPIARLLASRPLVWLGDASYATYLVHWPLFILAKLLLVGEDLQMGRSGFAAYLLVLLVLSGLCHRCLERPAQAWLNRLGPATAQACRPDRAALSPPCGDGP